MAKIKRSKENKRLTKRLVLTFSDGKNTFQGVSSNLSPTGLFIRTRKALSPGLRLKIVLELENKTTIDLEGEVAWSLKTGLSDFKNGMGVKLTKIPPEYDKLIQSFGL